MKWDALLFEKVWKTALPIMVTNFLQAAVMIVDMAMIGRLGPVSISAVGMANVSRMLLLIMILSVAAGAMTLVAQAKGSRDPVQISNITKQSIISGALLGLVLMFAGYFTARALITFMNNGAELETIEIGTSYLQIIFLGAPFLVFNTIANRLMQGAGDTITPMLVIAGMNVLNFVFNYLLIFGWGAIPALGVDGAALGSVLARVFAVVAAAVIFMSQRNVIKLLPGKWRFDWPLIKDILNIGVPSGIQGVFRHGANFALMSIVTATQLGTFGAAALAIGTQVESLVTQPTVGMNVASTSLVGQELGKWQPKEAFRKGTFMVGLAFIMCCLIVLPLMLYAREIVLLFDPSANQQVLEGGISYFWICSASLPIAAIGITITGTLRGAGDTKPAMLSAILGKAALSIGVAYYLVYVMDIGFMGVWIAIVAGRVFDGLFLLRVWMKRKWVYVALKQTAIYRQHLHKLSPERLNVFLQTVRTVEMTKSGMIEVVGDDFVRYRNRDGELLVDFAGDGYSTGIKR